MKFPEREGHQERIRLDHCPRKAKKYRQDRDGFREDWGDVKDEVMYSALEAKFTQHPDLTELLYATGKAYLVEHTRGDKYWADGGDGGSGEKGKNMLGKLLVKLRN